MKEEKPGPLTLDEAEQWLIRLEDIATVERDLGFATRLVFAHLIKHLNQVGLINAEEFLTSIMKCTPSIDAKHERIATEVLLSEFFRVLKGNPDDGQLH